MRCPRLTYLPGPVSSVPSTEVASEVALVPPTVAAAVELLTAETEEEEAGRW